MWFNRKIKDKLPDKRYYPVMLQGGVNALNIFYASIKSNDKIKGEALDEVCKIYTNMINMYKEDLKKF